VIALKDILKTVSIMENRPRFWKDYLRMR
jgi:hypothetical protein